MRTLTAILILAACGSAAAASPANLDAALRVLQGGNPAAARSMLETLTARDPRSAVAWRALGSAYQQLHEDRHAIDAFQRALALEPDSPKVFYGLGSSYAALHDATHAFEWRGEAANDQFGWIARNIGDVDGDGIADVVTSAPTHGAGGSNAGKIYVYSV